MQLRDTRLVAGSHRGNRVPETEGMGDDIPARLLRVRDYLDSGGVPQFPSFGRSGNGGSEGGG
jgi:hypothetical protein